MTLRRGLSIAGFTTLAALLGWLLFVGLPRWYGTPVASTTPPSTPTAAAPGDGRTIKTRLFYVSEDGTRLTPFEYEVPYAERTVEQARYIVEAQLAAARFRLGRCNAGGV